MKRISLKNLSLELGAAVACSFAGFWAAMLFYDLLLESGMYWYPAGDKSNGIVGIFVGCPLGSLLGVVLVDRWVVRSHPWNVIGIILGLFLSYPVAIAGLYATSRLGLGSIMFLGFPLIISIGVCIGYRVGALFRLKV
ncbi:MAG: hypothetical protein WC740_14610 [Verrucomicrobiia bacterium]